MKYKNCEFFYTKFGVEVNMLTVNPPVTLCHSLNIAYFLILNAVPARTLTHSVLADQN